MRVLNVEDYPVKHYEIKSALNRLGITDITLEETENDAIISVLESIENNNSFARCSLRSVNWRISSVMFKGEL